MRRLGFSVLAILVLTACAGGAPAGQEEREVAQQGPAIIGVPVVVTLAGTGDAGGTEGPGLEASLNEPSDLFVDADGSVYLAEYRGARVVRISPDGVVSTIVGGRTGNVDGPADEARLGTPRGIVLADDGNLYISDWDNRSIRRITMDGTVTTVLEGSFIETLALLPDGNILLSMGPDREQIASMTLDGKTSPVAGSPQHGGYRDGPASEAQFTLVSGLAAADDGWIYATEAVSMRTRGGNQLIRAISPDGEVSTLSGRRFVTAYQDGPAEEATFHHPVDIEVDAAGNLYVADSLNHCIRRISPDLMVSTLAGVCGEAGYADGPGDEALFNLPEGLALGPDGSVYVADTRNHRVRKITFE